jgi:hypothetical protein
MAGRRGSMLAVEHAGRSSRTEAWLNLEWEKRVATNLGPCPDCGHPVSRLAEACPSCGRTLRMPRPREGLFLRTLNQATTAGFWVLFVLILVPILAAIAGFLITR